MAAKVGVILTDVLVPNQTLDIAALVAPGMQLLFGVGMRRAARVPLQSSSAPSWHPRVAPLPKTIALCWGEVGFTW